MWEDQRAERLYGPERRPDTQIHHAGRRMSLKQQFAVITRELINGVINYFD